MRVSLRSSMFVRPLVAMCVGIAVLVLLILSGMPMQVVDSLPSNLELAAASAAGCAAAFSFAALFLVAGAREFVGYTTALEITDDGFTLTNWLRPVKRYTHSNASKLLTVPNREDLVVVWVLVFDDGKAFAVDSSSHNFDEAFRWIEDNLDLERSSIGLDEVDPSLAIPDWVARFYRRLGG